MRRRRALLEEPIAIYEQPGLAALNDFLSHASLEAGEHQAIAGTDALQLMTAHSAKGLEFDAVFISGLEEGLFPHENSLNEADGVEERRLMYVALTRARRRSVLELCANAHAPRPDALSHPVAFLTEIPAELLRRIVPRAPAWVGRGQNMTVTVTPYSAPGPTSPWRVGQDVMHPKFGAGVIVSVQGRGADARVMRQLPPQRHERAGARIRPPHVGVAGTGCTVTNTSRYAV